MKSKLFFLILFLNVIIFCKAQDSTVVLDTSMFDKYWKGMSLGGMNGWIYKQGNDTTWARKEIDLTGWEKFKPTELTIKNADKNGKVEGWFRIKIKPDSSFVNRVLISSNCWAVEDIYIDGQLAVSFGNTGANGKPFEERTAKFVSAYPVDLKPGKAYIIAVHFIDSRSPFKTSVLRADGGYDQLLDIGTLNAQNVYVEFKEKDIIYRTIFASVCAVLSVLFWLLYFLNRSQKNLPLIAIGTIILAAFMYCIIMGNTYSGTFVSNTFYGYALKYLGLASEVTLIFILAKLIKGKIPLLVILFAILFVASALFIGQKLEEWADISLVLVCLCLVLPSWKNLKSAQWAVVVGLLLLFISDGLFSYDFQKYNDFPFPHAYLYMAGIFLSLPLSLMVYVAIRFKQILKEVQTNAQQVVQLSEEKKEQAIKQQQILEEEVARQTIELRTSFENLKSTQAQLIQSEKMASLGELTAGIAHEIQNPLNFVNNFSEVNDELLEEVNDENDVLQIKIIVNDIKQNNEKISFHGKRADSIVKSMMQHSRTSTGHKEPTDINALCDEYLRLSYHGMRAKDKSFNADFKTDFDESIGKINIIPQDIGRVLLNLFNNAFYATNEKLTAHRSLLTDNYKPLISVKTKKVNDKVEIRVTDNGNGIPQKVLDKIFQPFFTTKPTGEGTGLGLSLSYDIIKAHGGEIKVETKEGGGSEFIIQLPFNNAL